METELREIEQYIEVVEAFSDKIEAARNRYEDARNPAQEATDSMEDYRQLQKQLDGNICLDIAHAVRRYKEADAKRRQELAKTCAQHAQKT